MTLVDVSFLLHLSIRGHLLVHTTLNKHDGATLMV